MNKEIFDPNAPAFGEGSQDEAVLTADTNESETKPDGEQPVIIADHKDSETEVETISADEGQPETQVPYSRFKKFHDQAKQAEQEALEWRAKYEALEQHKLNKTHNPKWKFQHIGQNFMGIAKLVNMRGLFKKSRTKNLYNELDRVS